MNSQWCGAGFSVVVLSMCVVGLWGCGESGGGSGGFTLSYDQPAQMDIPSSIRTLAVQSEESRNSDARWARVTADKMADRLQTESSQGRYVVVERASLQKMLEEQDLQLAFGNPDAAAQNLGKLKAVDAIVFSSVQVSHETRNATRTKVSLSASVGSESYTKYFVTVNMSVKLVDIATGTTVVSHSRKYDYDSDRDEKKSTITALLGGESNMPATDVITDALIERGVQDFVAKISPYTVRVVELLAKGKSASVTAGNALALAGDPDGALAQYQAALDLKGDDHGAAFNAGLMYESKGDFRAARTMYAKAVSLNGKETRYGTALTRVTR